jgi:hypothetical protein
VRIDEEPRHRLVYQNHYTRVFDVVIPPGDTTRFHVHAAPMTGVVIQDGRNWTQTLGALPGPVKAGSVYDTVGHQFGTQKETVTVTDYEPGRKFSFESQGKIGTVRHGFELAPSGDSTRVTKWMDIVKPSFMTKLMMPMIKRQAPPLMEEDLKRIKAKVEA